MTSDGAVVVVTGRGDVVALTEYSTRKLGQRQHNVEQIEVNMNSIQGTCLTVCKR